MALLSLLLLTWCQVFRINEKWTQLLNMAYLSKQGPIVQTPLIEENGTDPIILILRKVRGTIKKAARFGAND